MFFALLLLSLILGFILLVLYSTRHFKYWKDRNIPYVKPLPFVGNILDACRFRRSIGTTVKDIHNSVDAPVVGFFVFDKPFLLIRDTNLIKNILVKDFDTFKDHSSCENYRDDPVGSSILFILKNPTWREVRSRITPAFTTGKMKQMFLLMNDVASQLTSYINDKVIKQDTWKTRELCGKYSTDVISTCALGVEGKCFENENSDFRVAARRVFDWNYSRALQMNCFFFAPLLVKIFKMRFLDKLACNFMTTVFTTTMHERETLNFHRGDLIDLLVKIRRENPQLSHEVLVSQAAQFFIAGMETSSTTLAFALYELCLQPSIQDRLRKEIQSSLATHKQITYQMIQEMKYLRMVVDETLRKYPILPFVDRLCNKDYYVPELDITIEKGIPVYISLYGFHYDPNIFPDPDKFDPERFSPENKPNIPPFTYMPFGEGPRNCIGARFGILSIELALVTILKEFEVSTAKDTEIPLKMDTKGLLIAPAEDINLKFKQVVQ